MARAPSVAHKTLSIWSGLSAAACLWLAACGPASARPALWTVSDADSRIVIFGSVHLLPEGVDWRPEGLDAALAGADDLWFETRTDAETGSESSQLAIQQGIMPAGESMLALLSPAGRERAERIGVRLGMPPASLDRLKPWLADVTLSVAFLAQQGAVANSGVERVLAEAAPGTTRRYLETPAEQIALFAQAPMADQLVSLEETLRQLDEEPEMFDRLIEAWVRGDQAAIESLGVSPLRKLSPVLYERVLTARNRRWAEAIAQRLAGSGETVIVVGAGHLVGPDGLPALLRKRGLTVEGP